MRIETIISLLGAVFILGYLILGFEGFFKAGMVIEVIALLVHLLMHDDINEDWPEILKNQSD